MEPRPERQTAPASYTAGSKSRWFCWSLTFILLIGVALRLWNVNHDFYHMDEKVAQAVVKNLSFPGQWDTNWAKTDLSDDTGFHYDQFNFSSYHYVLYFWKSLVSAAGADWVNHPGILRALNGLFGLSFILTVALTARQLIGEIAGIAAASAGAIMPHLVEDAHFLRCEAMLTAGVAMLLWLVTRRDAASRWLLFSGGLLVGWLVACKATTGLAALLLPVALIKGSNSQERSWCALGKLAGMAGLGLVAGVILGVPCGIAQPQLYLSSLTELAKQYSAPLPPFSQPDMSPSIGMALRYMNGTLGWGFLTVAALGLYRMFHGTARWLTLLLLSTVVGALVAFGIHAVFTDRSYSPFLPVVIVFYSAGVQWAIETIMSWLGTAQRQHASLLLALTLSFTLMVPTIHTWKLVFKVFSGQERLEEKKAIVQMKGNLTGTIIAMDQVAYYAENYQTIIAAVERNEPVLVIVLDFNDAYSKSCLSALQGKFNGRILGVRESIFPGLPPCFLNTFISPRLWLIHIPPK